MYVGEDKQTKKMMNNKNGDIFELTVIGGIQAVIYAHKKDLTLSTWALQKPLFIFNNLQFHHLS